MQILLNWYVFTKMLKQNDKNITINNEEIKQGKNVMNIIKKCQRILDLVVILNGKTN